VLIAVSRHGSVTAAAHALNYAQPSVSHHLARLEAETGTKLVQRVGRGIRLTDAGRLLAERAVEIIGRLDAAENELAVFTGLRAGRLRLAAFPSALGTIVPTAAAILHDRHPGFDLRLTEAEPPEALRMLRAGYVDVALIFRHSAEPSALEAGLEGEENVDVTEGLRERLLLDEPVYLITSARESCPSADVTDLAQYARHRWIAGCDRCRAHLIAQCSAAGFAPKIAFTTDDFVAVQALVAADLGVSTLPALCLRAARHPGIKTFPLPDTRRFVYAVRYGDPPDPPAVTEVMDALRAAAERPRAADLGGRFVLRGRKGVSFDSFFSAWQGSSAENSVQHGPPSTCMTSMRRPRAA
jgi:DNA-binding transcriptional LysR family regulator